MHFNIKNIIFLIIAMLTLSHGNAQAREKTISKTQIKKCIITTLDMVQKKHLAKSIEQSKHVYKKLRNKNKILKEYIKIHDVSSLLYTRGAELLLKKDIFFFKKYKMPEIWPSIIMGQARELKNDRIFKKLYMEHSKAYSKFYFDNRMGGEDEVESVALDFINQIQSYPRDTNFINHSCYPEDKIAQENISSALPAQSSTTAKRYQGNNNSKKNYYKKTDEKRVNKDKEKEAEPQKKYYPKYIYQRTKKDNNDEKDDSSRPKYIAR